ncbi:YkyA family protein [Macrococcoides canis]|uniref:YkyA family protein n=1 Tax=Macrococcoides canis TaxID=1855823 RepID=UPI00105ED5F9|nr:YkyA family protein [Macrococcus canis]TDM34432.1 hypothetical protein ETI13_01215 [Macrococcus canis]
MKISKLLFAGLMVLLLAACQGKTEVLGNFATKIDESVKAETPVKATGEKLQRLENDKVKIFNQINKAKQGEIKGYAEKLLKNADDRRKAIDEEVKAMDKSKGIYEDAKAMTKDIKDETQKKQVESFIDVNDKKYAQHQKLMSSYKDILTTEKDVFTYLKQPQPESKVVNGKIENVTKKYEQFKKDTTAYANMLRAVEQEKQKMTDILNGK